MKLRTAALLAAIAQALWGITTIWPEVIGSSQLVTDQGIPLGIVRLINAFVPAAVLVFYTVIFLNNDQLLVPRLLKRVSFLAAVMIGIQNIGFLVGDLGAILQRSHDRLQWQYHPFYQLRNVLSPLIPLAWVVSTIFFLVAAGKLPGTLAGPQADGHSEGNAAMVKAAAALAATGAAVELGAAAYELVHFRLFSFSSVLQVAIDASLLLFLGLMCKSEVISDSAKACDLQPT
jgi:hypothetical protein